MVNLALLLLLFFVRLLLLYLSFRGNPLYSLYTECIKADDKQGFKALETLRQKLIRDETIIKVEDMGAGSRAGGGPQRKVSNIARYAGTPPRFSRLLARLIHRFQSQTVVELGTSLGLNTLYMALANPAAQLYTLEGSKRITSMAGKHFKTQGTQNIRIIEGNIDQTLEILLADLTKIDLLYMDANHRYEPTIRYFEQTLPKLHQNSLLEC